MCRNLRPPIHVSPTRNRRCQNGIGRFQQRNVSTSRPVLKLITAETDRTFAMSECLFPIRAINQLDPEAKRRFPRVVRISKAGCDKGEKDVKEEGDKARSANEMVVMQGHMPLQGSRARNFGRVERAVSAKWPRFISIMNADRRGAVLN